MARAATTLDTTQLARLFDITPRHLRRLTADGVFTRARDTEGNELRGRYDLAPNLNAYVKYLKSKARIDDASETRYAQLRNQRMEAENEMAQIRLQQIKSEMHDAKDVEFVLTNMIAVTKNHLLAIPSRVARLVVGKTKFQEIYDLMLGVIEQVLRELAACNAKTFQPQMDAHLAEQGADPASLTDESESLVL